MRGGENLLVFPRALVGAERLIFVGDVDELDAGEAGLEVDVDLMRDGSRADKADAAQVRALGAELLIKLLEVDDDGVRIFLVRHHEDREAANLGDGGVHLCERLRLRAAQQIRLALDGNENRALFKLTAPAGQVPAVGHVQLVKVDESRVKALGLQNLADLSQSFFGFCHVVVRHFCFSFTCYSINYHPADTWAGGCSACAYPEASLSTRRA